MRRCVETAIMTSNSGKLNMPELQTTNFSGSEKDPDELPPTQVFPAAKLGIDDKEKVAERNGKIADKQEKNTSDEEFIDIRPNVRVKKADFTTEKIESLIVKCTACRNQINHHDSHRVKKHPHLGVVICKECLEFYDTGEFSQDDDGDKYCRWCAQGGTLYSCDFCNNTFCNECVRYNFGRGEVRRIKEQKWKCYICEPEKMDGKVKFCELLCQYSKGKTLKRKPNKTFRSNNVMDNDNDDLGSPLKFIPKFLSEAIQIANEFKIHVQKLNQKLDSNAKSPKQLLRKFEQLISILRSNTKDTLIEANGMYNSYIKDRTSRLVPDSSSSAVKSQGDIPNTVDNLINSVANHFGEKLMTNQHLDNELDQTRSASSDRLNTTDSINNSGENLEPAADVRSDSKHSTFFVKENLELNSSECKSGKSLSPVMKPAMPIKKESARKQFVKTESLVKKSKGKELVITLTSSSSELDFSEKPKIVKKSNSNDETIQSDKDIQSNILSTKLLVSNRTLSMETLKNEEIESKAPLSSDKKGKATKDGHLRLVSSSSSASSNTSSLESTAETDGETKKRVCRKKTPVSKKKPTFTKDEVAQWNDEKKEKLKDEKLQMKAVVELCRLGIPQAQIEAALRPIEKSKKKKSLTAMERSVQRLLNEPLKRKRSVTSDDHEEGFKPACKKKSTTTTADSSDSDALSLASFSDSNSSSKALAHINTTTINTSDIKPFSRLFHNSETDDDDSSSGRDLEEMSKNEKSLLKSTKKKAEPSDLEESDNSVVSVKSIKDSDSDDDFCAPRKVSKKDDKLIKKANSAMSNEKDDEKSEGKGEKGKSKAKEKKKGKRRKIIYSDDSGTSGSSDSRNESAPDSDFEDSKKKKKGRSNKRKRIKIDNSSDEEDEDPSSQSTPGKGRKNIRKVISEKSLEQETIEAQMMEKERRKRLQDRQKLYNQITDTAEDGKEIITRKMVLEIDPDSKEEVMQIHPDIIEKLKPHQVNGVKFMWEATIESLKLLETKPGSGCILAHCMGLGKTLQVIAFLYTLLTNKYTNKKLRTAMIVCPNNTVMNWAKEFDYWQGDGIDAVKVFEMVMIKDYHSRLELLKNWQKDGGVLILGYDIFARLVEGKIPKKNKEFKNKVFTKIADPGADIVVCDEGHKLKNEKSLLSRCANKLRTQRRIVLTGTPLQNNLKEYYCMMNFVKPRLLGTFKEFTNRFVNPIVNGQYDDSSKHDVKLMKKRVHILHKLLEGCVQRCDYSALTHFLPPKHEFVISVKLSEVQIKLYQYYLDQNSRVGNNEYGEQKVDGRKLFPDYSILKNVWTFPYALQLNYERLERQRILKGDDDVDDDGNLKNFVDDGSLSGNSSTSSANGDELTCLDDEPQPGPSRRKTRNMKAQDNDSSGDEVIKKYPRPEAENLASDDDDILLGEKQWFHKFISQEDQFKAELSGKITLTLEILKECESIGDKVLIFSTSLITLDIIEMFLKHINDQPITSESVADESRDISHTWVPEIDYFRMDGKCPVEIRERYMTKFNQKDNIRARLMLISTKAGSLGTNLVGANRVILLDASWNPSDDVQSIFRVYRFGQVKPVYIYRFLAQGTMEEKIYNRQVTKLSMSCRVVDEQNIDRHFNASQLSELYTFEPDTRVERPTLMVPKDRLLADLIITHKEWIVTYFEHDSLLQHTKEDDLTEEERQAAWTEYENEKEGIFMNNNNEYAASAGPGLHAINMATIVKNFTNEIIRNRPSINQFELKSTLVSNMTKFKYQMQREHTTLLRKKQESVSFGLPAAVDVNQALENLQIAMRHCDSYVTQIKRAILTDMQNIRQQHQRAHFNTAQAFQNAGHSAGIRVGDAGFQQQFMQSRPAFMAQNVTRFQNMVPPATFRFGYARVPTPPSSGPTIVDITEEEKSSERESHNDSPIVTFNEEPPEPKKAPSSSAHSVKITEVE